MLPKKRDLDEKQIRKRNIRLRFKRLVLNVMLNQQWMDDPEEQGIVMNAKRNVAFLIRQKRKTGVLTVAEKSLLRTPHANRTVEDRKKLCLIVAGLPCFSHLPPKLRVRLIPYLRYSNYGEDRMLIRQNDIPITVYFMISGEVEMRKNVIDKSTKKTTMVSEAIVGVGDVIGDVALLEDCLRLNTYVTLTHCEVLSITDDEFKTVLGKFMRKQWKQKKMAIRSLTYFSFFSEEQMVRACAYCQLEQYDPLQSIYSEDRGAVSCVHFILSGECVVLQCLKMFRVIKEDGTRTYELISVKEKEQDIFVNPTKSARSFNSSFLDEAQRKDKQSESEFNIAELLASSSDLNTEESRLLKKAKRKTGLREIEIACGLANDTLVSSSKKKLRGSSRRITPIHKHSMNSMWKADYEEDEEGMVASIDEDDVIDDDKSVKSENGSTKNSDPNSSTTRFSKSSTIIDKQPLSEVELTTTVIGPKLSRTKNVTVAATDASGSGDSDDSSSSLLGFHIRHEKRSLANMPTETHFIDVGSMTYGGIFGLGEKITHRVIMARTVVQCLLLPRYWLMATEQNPGHIWLRRRFSLETNIPSREELFNHFMKTRRWEKFKHDYVQSTLVETNSNGTHLEDIPIICRIVETTETI
ncbi:hypothetical protein AWZ03_012598 [Drosophila navojoa]|uniref:Cyclic nucleotide-binding domain-containing protein n=1 Tax=Drosophila navojoa TaxID=7232 RepID=A0A484AX50_DRONA|nr:uncharacterized protein LOC115564548 [Drosophila navojoa]TDG40973.1 hypothetical protein AWZ03_012598 [Drosophila navojoa]